MLTLSLIRHGATEGNLRRAYIGSTDQPLCDAGRAALAGLEYPQVEQVFASPMKRCIETAKLLYPGTDIQLVEGLRERDFGDYENLSHAEIIALPGCEHWGKTPESMEFPDGEEWEPFLARCTEAFWSAMKQAAAVGTTKVAVVSHGGVIMAILEGFCRSRRPYCGYNKVLGHPFAIFDGGNGSGSYYEWNCSNGAGYLLRCELGRKVLTVIRRIGV